MGTVNLITESGTNSFHGGAFENFQSDNLNSRLQFLSTKPNAVFNQFGGSLGGPIKRDRIFFFESAYVGNRGVKFPINRTYNFPDRVTCVRPNPQISQGYYLDNSQTSWYHSWQTSLRKRFSKNLNFAVRYTWGKQLSNDSGDIGAYYQNDANVRAQDSFNLRREWGPPTATRKKFLRSPKPCSSRSGSTPSMP